MTERKVQDTVSDQFRKHDKVTKKTKRTNITDKETLDQQVTDDETETVVDGVDNGSDDEGTTDSEGVGDNTYTYYSHGSSIPVYSFGQSNI